MNHEELITAVREVVATVHLLDKEIQELRVEVKELKAAKKAGKDDK